MKLNPDCVRTILLVVEDLPDLQHYYRFNAETIPSLFPDYSVEEIMYHLRQCELSNLIFRPSHTANYEEYTVSDLTPKGHEFLANIRENKIWSGVKTIAGKVGSTSLDAITQIASNVITELIKAQFGLMGSIS